MKKKITKKSPQEEIRILKRKLWAAERLRHDAVTKKSSGSAKAIWDGRLLAAGVAHEFNNILGAADGHAEWALESKQFEDMREALEVVRQACARSLQITKSLQEIPNPDEESVEIFNLNKFESELKKHFAPWLRKHKISLSVQLPIASIYGNEARLYEIFVNLIKNALEACAEYSIKDKNTNFEVNVSGALTKTKCKIFVDNNGPEIADVLRDKIFLPFFTTKGRLSSFVKKDESSPEITQGSGLGLFLSRSLTQQMGGSLDLICLKNKTRFQMTLPRK